MRCRRKQTKPKVCALLRHDPLSVHSWLRSDSVRREAAPPMARCGCAKTTATSEHIGTCLIGTVLRMTIFNR